MSRPEIEGGSSQLDFHLVWLLATTVHNGVLVDRPAATRNNAHVSKRGGSGKPFWGGGDGGGGRKTPSEESVVSRIANGQPGAFHADDPIPKFK